MGKEERRAFFTPEKEPSTIFSNRGEIGEKGYSEEKGKTKEFVVYLGGGIAVPRMKKEQTSPG